MWWLLVKYGECQEPHNNVSINIFQPTEASNSHLFESWDDNAKDGEYLSTKPPPSPSELGEFDTAAVSADGQPCAQIAT